MAHKTLTIVEFAGKLKDEKFEKAAIEIRKKSDLNRLRKVRV